MMKENSVALTVLALRPGAVRLRRDTNCAARGDEPALRQRPAKML
jgi:hypothetical protein